MLRNVRKITPLLRSLLLGVAAVSAVSLSSVAMVGCEDENQPEYFIKRLEDPMVRPQAVKRLDQFFEDAMTKANKNRADAKVVSLLDRIVPPLTKIYLDGDSTDRSKGDILKLLADTRDDRAKAAWIKSVQDYKPNVDEPELRAASKAISETGVRDQAAMDALIAAFVKFRASSPKGALIYLDIRKAMVDISHQSWTPQLVERLNRPMAIPTGNDRTNDDKIAEYRDEQFWQNVAAEILGEIKSIDAIKPLFKTVLDPNKADVAATSVMAMVKIGKPTMSILIDALLGQDEEILEFAKSKIKDPKEAAIRPVQNAALVIGTVGRADAVESMIVALGKVDKADYATQAIIARELTKCPVSPQSLQAYLRIFESMPLSAVIPPGEVAVQTLADQIAQFYDSSIVDVLIKRRDTLKGDQEDKDMMRDSVLTSIIKLMRADQVETVEKALSKWAPGKDEAKAEKDALAKSKKLLTDCGDKIECYLAKLDDAALQEKEEQFYGIKAAYMIAMLGNDQTRLELVKRFPTIKNGAVKFAAAKALEYLTPNGDQAVADEIGQQLAVNVEKGDQNLIQGDAPLRQIRYRLLARL